MPAQIKRHQPVSLSQRPVHLLFPAKVMLRPAMNKQNRQPVFFAAIAHKQLYAVTALDMIGG